MHHVPSPCVCGQIENIAFYFDAMAAMTPKSECPSKQMSRQRDEEWDEGESEKGIIEVEKLIQK